MGNEGNLKDVVCSGGDFEFNVSTKCSYLVFYLATNPFERFLFGLGEW